MKFFVKVLLVLVLLLIPMKVFSPVGQDYPEHVSFTGQDLSVLPNPKNPLYVGVEGTLLEGEGTTRLLQLGEKVFLIAYEDDYARVMDRQGRIGKIFRGSLSETQELGHIESPIEGVSYEANLSKAEAFRQDEGTRGIYISREHMYNLQEYIEEAEGSIINTFVFDYKVAGNIYFESDALKEHGINASGRAYNGKEFLAPLKEAGIKSIAKIDAFRSPNYARANPTTALSHNGEPLLYQDLYWISPYDRDHWRYVVDIAKEALDAGFDEVQFDFVRFPIINVEDVDYHNTRSETRAEAVQKFLYYAEEALRPYQRMVSANLYGRSSHYPDDEGVGMQFEAISNAVDVVSPMIFPSYYGEGNLGVSYPEEQAYELVKANVEEAHWRNRNLKTPALLRPWLQAFSQAITYDEVKINDMIKALDEEGIQDFLLYNEKGEYPIKALRRP